MPNKKIIHRQIEKNGNENLTKEVEKYPKENIQETYKGYSVCAKLEIPEIKLEIY